MFVRVAIDPGPSFQQRLHLSDMELINEGQTDANIVASVHHNYRCVRGIAVWRPQDEDWRLIEGSMPGLKGE